MTDDLIELGKRAVACKGWRWMPGMAAVQGERVVLMDDDGTLRLVTAVRSFFDSSGACLPDLSDPATVGCLLALVREAWGRDDLGASRYKERWCVERWCGDIRVFQYGTQGDTEAEALVAVLEAAP